MRNGLLLGGLAVVLAAAALIISVIALISPPDAAKRASLVGEIGGEKLRGMYGTAGASAPGNPATADWKPPSSPSTANCPFSRTSKRPTMRPSPLLLRPRLQVVSTEPQSAIICGISQDHPAGPSRALPKGSPMAYPCLLKARRSTSMVLPVHWIGTKTATSVEVT